MHTRLRLALAATVVLLAGVAHAASGVTIVSERSAAGAASHRFTLVLDANHVRVDTDGDEHGKERGPTTVIIDVATGTMAMVRHAKRDYMVMNRADMDRAARSMAAFVDGMKQRLPAMSPADRARVEPSLRAYEARAREHQLAFAGTGQKQTVAGVACEITRVTDEGRPFEEDCIARYGARGSLTRADADVFRKVAALFSVLAGTGQTPAAGELAKYPGYPVARRRVDAGGHVLSEERIVSITRGTLAADAFLVPDGYTQQQATPPRAAPSPPVAAPAENSAPAPAHQ